MRTNPSLVDKTYDALDQMVLPASTLEVYNRMLKLGHVAGVNPARERADVSSALGKLRKANKVHSDHDDSGVLLWDIVPMEKPVIRITNEKKTAIRDEIARVRRDLPMQIVLAELFDELAQSLSHAANVLRKMQ